MTWHPLDGNMIAADAHHGQGKWPEAGDKCQHCEEGHYDVSFPEEGCTCHLNPPCAACVNEPLRCDTCWEAAE